MQEVYEVKVRSRGDACQLYPSERRYSASTVGGLGLVHLLLGATTLLLASLGLAAEDAAWTRYGGGVALGVAAMGAAAGAMLAWRRWYVDNNIRHYLAASIVTGVVAVVCLIATVVALASLQEEMTSRRLEALIAARSTPRVSPYDIYSAVASETYDSVPTSLNASDVDAWYVDNSTLSDAVPTELDIADVNATLTPFFHGEPTYTDEIRSVLLINILIAAVLELVWCVLSARIAWRGVQSDYEGGEVKKRQRVVDGGEKVRPDILHNVMRGVEVGGDANLPQRESCVEYEERVRRFLASNNLQGGVAPVVAPTVEKTVQ